MDAKTKTQLELAKAYCFQWRLQEAHSIFRRYFDRLPLRPEPEHAEYIGYFVRTLLELGKDYDLKFYTIELEKLHARGRELSVVFQLAYLYLQSTESRSRAAKELFEQLVSDPTCHSFHTRAKINLILIHFRAAEYA